MRSRILVSTLFVVAVTALVLGGPLAFTTWRLVDDFTRAELIQRLEQIAGRLDDQPPGSPIDSQAIALAIPSGGRLEVRLPGYPTASVGADAAPGSIAETLPFGSGGSITLFEPESAMRTQQLQVVVIVLLLVLLSVGTGAVVATVTARRLAEPLLDVADRAARLGAGDFRLAPDRLGIPELDRVSDVLDASAGALAELLQRERNLVGDVSHQLRSRITALILRLDELSTHPDPGARKEALAALEQTEKLSEVLDELLEAARAARAAGAEPVDLRQRLLEVADEWRPGLESRGRKLKLRAPEGLLARVTPARLREAVGALVDNAMRHGAGTVTVTAREGTNALVVEVSDTGAGIPEELVPHVFDRGVSVQSSTGLGLALARTLIEADGGRLELSRARPPTFTIFLPPSRADDVVSAPPRPSRTPR